MLFCVIPYGVPRDTKPARQKMDRMPSIDQDNRRQKDYTPRATESRPS